VDTGTFSRNYSLKRDNARIQHRLAQHMELRACEGGAAAAILMFFGAHELRNKSTRMEAACTAYQ
jgi:hypothetical protein